MGRPRIKAWPARGGYWRWTLALVVLLLCARSNDGQGWKQQTYPNVTNTNNVDFGSAAWSTPTTCVVAGIVGGYNAPAGGSMIRSTTAGSKWSAVFSDTTAPIYDVAATFAASPSSAPPCYVAVSSSGAVYVSRDNGASFVVGQTLPAKLYGAAVGATGNAYVVGASQTLYGNIFPARIYRVVQWQQNGCPSTFVDVSPPGTSNPPLLDVASLDDRTVIAVGGSGAILRSDTSGATWASVASGVTATLQCVSAGNATVALAAGDGGTLLRTINGGNTWTLIALGSAVLTALPTATFRYHALSMVGPSVAYAAASPSSGISPGIIIRTLDGGKAWTVQFTAAQTGQSIVGLAMLNSFIGVAGFSRSSTTGGPTALAVRSMDAPTGQPSAQPSVQPSTQPTLRPTGWPTGYTAPTSANYGWNAVPTGAGSAVFTSAAWSSSTYNGGACALLAGTQFSSGVLLQSCDGGATWTAVAPLTTWSSQLLYTDVTSFGNATTGYFLAVTNAGYVYVSSTQGLTWGNPLAAPSSLGGVAVGANGVAFVVGGSSAYSKYFYTSTAATGFSQWTDVTPRSLANTTLQFNGVSTYDGTNVIAVGNAGLVYYSFNAGQSWGSAAASALAGAGDLSCVSSGNSLVAYVGAATLWKTYDGGVTWGQLAAATKLLAAGDKFRFHSVSAQSGDVVYAASASGVLLRSINGGATFTVESSLTAPGSTSVTQSHCLSMYNDRSKPRDRGMRGLAGDDGGIAYVKSFAPTPAPTRKPLQPTDTRYPSLVPTPAPTVTPSTASPSTPRPSTPRPSVVPTFRPSSPSGQPTQQPTAQPSEQPTEQPTSQPAGRPTMRPSRQPTSNPTAFSLYTYKLPGVPFAQSPSWVQPPLLPLTTIDFVASAWSPAGAAGSVLPTCVMVGYNDNFGGIVRSTNGGGFWSTVAPPSTNTGLSTRMADVAASPATRGLGSGTFIAVALSGDIYVSSNNGVSFQTPGPVNPASPPRLQGVTIGLNGYAYTVGLSTSTSQQASIYRATAINAFSSWTPCNIANAPQKLLTAVTTRDGVSVIAVGTSGTVLYTANNGTSWAAGVSGVTATLQCVSAANAAVAMAAGDGGTLLLTTTGGSTWVDVSRGLSAAAKAALGPSPSFKFHAISMVSTTVAFVASSAGIILRTLNGGAYWAIDYVSPDASTTSPTIVSLSMVNGYTGVAGYARGASGVGGRVVARTLDSPTSQPTSRPTGQPSGQPSTRPTAHPTGYDYTDGLANTGAGGVVWNSVPTSLSNNLFGTAWGRNASVVIMVGDYQYTNGLILRSTDGGYSWKTRIINSGVVLQYTGVAYFPGSSAAARGAFVVTSSNGSILLSADGSTWNTAYSMAQKSFTGVAVGTNGLAYVVSSGGDILRANASVGLTKWVPVSTANGQPVAFQAVSTFDGVNVIVLSKDGLVFYTTNAGPPWSSGVALASVLTVASHGSSLVAYVGGPAGALFRTVDGGQNWQSLTADGSLAAVLGLQSLATTGFQAISALSSAIVYVGTTDGAIVRTINGGATFMPQRSADAPNGITTLAMFSNNRRFTSSRGLLGVAVNSLGTVLVKALTPTAAPTPLPTSTYSYVWLPASTGNAANVAVAGAWGGGRFNPVLVGYRAVTTPASSTASTVGVIVASRDGGLTWAPGTYTRSAAALVGSFTAPWKVNDVASFTDAGGNTTFLAVLSPGVVLTSTNTQGAANWAMAANVTTTALSGAAVASGNGVAVVVASNLVSSRRTVFVSTYPAPVDFAAAVQRTNASNPRAVVYRNWTDISPTAAAGLPFTAVAVAADASTVIAVGLGGTVYVATCAAGGAGASMSAGVPAPSAACLRASWTKASAGVTADLYCVSVSAGGSGGSASTSVVAVAGGNGATVLRTDNGGKTWVSLTATIITQLGGTLSVMNNVRFHSCTMLTAQVFYFAATNGVVVKSVDGGATFSLDASIRSPSTAGAAPVSCLAMYNGADALARGIVAGVAGDAGGYAYTKYVAPSSAPTYEPTLKPLSPTDSRYPTTAPTSPPTQRPTVAPTAAPTYLPTGRPSSQPSRQPTRQPTSRPSLQPTAHPSAPTGQPTARPSSPSGQPTEQPTRQPTEQPTRQPTAQPSEQPTNRPTAPSGQPTSRPTNPTGQPTTRPSRKPTPVGFTYQPSEPTMQPNSESPSRTRPPSSAPSRPPSRAPSATPTLAPTSAPTATPAPTAEPSLSSKPTPAPSPPPVASAAPMSPPTASPTTVPMVLLTVTDHRIDGVDLVTAQSPPFAAAIQSAVATALSISTAAVAVVSVTGSPVASNAVSTPAVAAQQRQQQQQQQQRREMQQASTGGTVYATYTALIPQSAVQAEENALGAAVASGQFSLSLQKAGFPNAISTVHPTNFAVVAVGPTAAPSPGQQGSPTAASSSGLSGGAVAGVVIGVLVGVAGIAAGVYWCTVRRPWAVRDVRGRPSQAYVEDFRDFELI